jgi:putative endonuclease
VSHFVYILESVDGRYYTGYTTDVAARLQKHATGRGAKFTRGFGVAKLVYVETLPDKSAALKREAAIKDLTRRQKEALVAARGELN